MREFVVSAKVIYDIDTTGIEMLERLLDDLDRLNVRTRSLACERTYGN